MLILSLCYLLKISLIQSYLNSSNKEGDHLGRIDNLILPPSHALDLFAQLSKFKLPYMNSIFLDMSCKHEEDIMIRFLSNSIPNGLTMLRLSCSKSKALLKRYISSISRALSFVAENLTIDSSIIEHEELCQLLVASAHLKDLTINDWHVNIEDEFDLSAIERSNLKYLRIINSSLNLPSFTNIVSSIAKCPVLK